MRPLFRGENDGETLQNILTCDIPLPEQLRPSVPPSLGAVALRALMRDRERRLPSAEAIADSIEAVAEAEYIDTSRDVLADLVDELFPATDEPHAHWPGITRGATSELPEVVVKAPSSRSARRVLWPRRIPVAAILVGGALLLAAILAALIAVWPSSPIPESTLSSPNSAPPTTAKTGSPATPTTH